MHRLIIILGGCPGSSESSLGAHGILLVCDDAANLNTIHNLWYLLDCLFTKSERKDICIFFSDCTLKYSLIRYSELSPSISDSLAMNMFCAKWESVQFRNCPAQSGNSHFVGRSRNSYFAQCNSGIARAQSGNRDKVRIRAIALVNSLLIFLNRG